MTQVVSVLTIAMIFTGLSIQIARFHSQSRGGLFARDKNTYAGTLAENGRGFMCEERHMGGILRYYIKIDMAGSLSSDIGS